MRWRKAATEWVKLSVFWIALVGGVAEHAHTVLAGAASEPASAVWSAATGSLSTNVASALAAEEGAAPVSTNQIRFAGPAHPFTWKDLLSPGYSNYIVNLRAIGCPEKRVRQIVISDVGDFFDQKRLDEAMRRDFEWWKTAVPRVPIFGIPGGATLEDRRTALLTKLLGTNCPEAAKLPSFSGGLAANLVGPVMGAMPLERYSAAAEVCERSKERLDKHRMDRFAEGQPPDPAAEARLRQQTRLGLGPILTPEEMEEFLLRNSHNAEALRQTLQGFDPTPDEFRKIFRALDSAQHQMQLDYGSTAALSAKQRDEFERQCDRAVQEVLLPDRFQAYMAVKDPLYRQAHVTATQRGLPAETVPKIYAVFRDSETRRQQVMQNDKLDQDQKTKALQALAQEMEQALQKLLAQKSATLNR